MVYADAIGILSLGSLMWKFELGLYTESFSAPAIGLDGTAYVGGTDGVFYAITATGEYVLCRTSIILIDYC